MNKKNLYIVFDQLPSKKTGGLVTTYVSLFNLLKDPIKGLFLLPI